ncbi:helix-turn-helix domain-containing protein [Candidatus Kaiserbacteria bacterium]|nr:helix-turn-helix domain-containing protein [Candidatus Kaiserbacteria bacterium]
MDFETRTLEGLQRIGFSDKEARVYVALLSIGQGDVTDIARKSALKRSIVYVVLERLHDAGYVSQLPGLKIRQYAPTDPDVVIHQSKSALLLLERSLDYYSNLEKTSQSAARVRYYDSLAAIEAVYAEQNAAGNLKITSSGKHLMKTFPSVWKDWKEKIESGEISLKGWQYMLNAQDRGTEVAKILRTHGATVRFLSGKGESLFDFVIWDKSVSITSLEHKPNMIVIESKKIHDSFEYFFDLLFANASA